MRADGRHGGEPAAFRIPFVLGFVLVLLGILIGMVVLDGPGLKSGLRLFPSSGWRDQSRAVEIVVIEASGAIRLNDKLVASAEDRELLGFRDRLKEQEALSEGRNPVAILPEPDVSHARVLEVLNICSASGIRNVFLRAADRKFRWRFKLGEEPPPPSIRESGSRMEMLIAIDADGSIRLNNETIGAARDRQLPRLCRKLKETARLFGEKTPVIVTPHPDSRLDRISDVLNACEKSGVRNVSLGGNWSVQETR